MKCVLCNSDSGTSYTVAKEFGWRILFASQDPDLSSFDTIIIICANAGDEELQPNMEKFLIKLETRCKKYAICELGNHFGYKRDCFGCKKIVQALLKKLEWIELNDISIDSFPELDLPVLKKWIKQIENL